MTPKLYLVFKLFTLTTLWHNTVNDSTRKNKTKRNLGCFKILYRPGENENVIIRQISKYYKIFKNYYMINFVI